MAESLCVTCYFPRRPCVGVAGSPYGGRPVLLCSAAVHFLICRIDRVCNRWNGVLIAGNNAFYGSTFIAVVSRIRYVYNVFTAHYEDNNVFFRCSPFCTTFIRLRRTASLVVECSLHVCGDAGSNSGMVIQSVFIDKITFLTSHYYSLEKLLVLDSTRLHSFIIIILKSLPFIFKPLRKWKRQKIQTCMKNSFQGWYCNRFWNALQSPVLK